MTKLFTDEQLKTSYTQKELVDLIERKATIAQRSLPVGYKRFNKSALIDEVRYLDNVIWNADDVEEEYIEDDGIVEGAALNPDKAIYVQQLPEFEQSVVKLALLHMAVLEGYTGDELQQAIDDGMNSKIADLELVKVELCTICASPTDEGFILNGDIHCSKHCRRQTMTDEEYEVAHAEDDDSFYWTAWYGEEY
jgi:hypothetical protein